MYVVYFIACFLIYSFIAIMLFPDNYPEMTCATFAFCAALLAAICADKIDKLKK